MATVDLDALPALPDDEWADVYTRVLQENERRMVVVGYQSTINAAAAQYEAAVADKAARDITGFGDMDVVGPGEKVRLEDGSVWRSRIPALISPKAAGPTQFPDGWEKVIY